ncbi:MFS transporter [Pseudomonas mandelii]|uniref:MFS transporter n=1 Tax=Pseudomonas mandelii TaxID=75612 RepID=A0A502IA76_9PSED|nr:MFS transporter [Pseudomonas mandelii]TPG83205.1 MFS transporter [Pseudomonas mandelii]
MSLSTQTPLHTGQSRPALILLAILLAIFVIPTSISGTAVALPNIAMQLKPELTTLQWVVTAFNLTFACFTLAWGAVADIIGRRLAFTLGALIYAAGALISATATDILVLDCARAVAGIGAAAIFSAGSAILATEFDAAARLKAFAMAGAAVGIGVGIGPTLSGLLVENIGWRAIFYVHAGIIGVVIAIIPAMRLQAPHFSNARIDYIGIALFVLSALLLVTGIVQGSQWGWSSRDTLGLFVLSVVSFAAFILAERYQRQPMLDLSILRNRQFVGWCLATVTPSFGFFTLLTYLPSYLSSVAGYSAGTTGLAMLLLALPLFICPVISAKLVEAGIKAKTVLFVSLGVLIVGDICLLFISTGASLLAFAGPMLLVGAGTGLCAGLADGQALGNVAPEKSGLAAGFLNTLRLGSETIAIAFYGSLLATNLHKVMSADLPDFATALDIKLLANTVATGNLTTPLQMVDASHAELFRTFMDSSYNASFHSVMLVLIGICILLSIVIIKLLSPSENTKPRLAAVSDQA